MKKFISTLAFLLTAFAVQSQITFRQGYYLIDTNVVTIYNNINYVLSVEDSTIILPWKTAKIVNTELTTEGLKFVLDNGDVGRYRTDPRYGEIFYIIWRNGRLVLWTNYIEYFNITLK